ncbi:MAG: DMP19 family protein [Oscillospiraceae bacterium]|nr:DMP19 family protein [Oscillospiraceae bacterium]
MSDFVKMWDNYSEDFTKKLIFQCKGDLRALDNDEQEIAALWRLVADVYNGGFIQFFCNWGYDSYWCAMRGIQRMGLRETLNLFAGTYTDVLDKFREDRRLKAYWDIPEYLTEEDEKILDETDQAFYDGLGEQLCEAAYKFYHDELKKTIEFDYLEMFGGLCDEYYRKLELEYNNDRSKLKDKEREALALHAMFSDIGNGGIQLFFENHDEDLIKCAIGAVEKVNVPNALELLKEAYEKVFPKLGNLTGTEEEILMKVDTTFWEGFDETLAEAAFKVYWI